MERTGLVGNIETNKRNDIDTGLCNTGESKEHFFWKSKTKMPTSIKISKENRIKEKFAQP
jgi:hypothetical protein